MTTDTTSATSATTLEDAAMTDTTSATTTTTSIATSLVVGDCYVLAGSNPGTVWALDGDNGRGWYLFSLVDGEDPKSTRRVRASAVLAPISCSGPVSELTGASPLAQDDQVATPVATQADGTQEEAPAIVSAGSAALVSAISSATTSRQTAKQERADRLAIAKQERALARETAKQERILAKIVAADAKAAAKAQALKEREIARAMGEEDEDDDASTPGRLMARTLKAYAVGYVPAKNATGGSTKTNGDPLAIAWLTLDVEAFCSYAGRLLGLAPSLYSHLNPGQQRMNMGNRIRAQIRKGTLTIDQALAAIAG